MFAQIVILLLAAFCFALHTMDIRHQRINLQSLGLLFLTTGILVAVWLR